MGNENKVIITIRYHKKSKKGQKSELNFQDENEIHSAAEQKITPKEIQQIISMPDLTEKDFEISEEQIKKTAIEPMIDTKTPEIQTLIEKENKLLTEDLKEEKMITKEPLQKQREEINEKKESIEPELKEQEVIVNQEEPKPKLIIPAKKESLEEKAVSESKELEKSTTSLFLDDEINQQSEKNLYSLYEEFAKTRKNKNIFSILLLGCFMFFLVGSTFFITEQIKKKGTQAQLEIKDFEDINLSEAINKARENEKRLGSLQDELNNSKKNFNSQLDMIKQQSEERIKGILTQGLPEKQRLKLIEEIRKKEQQEIYNAKMLHESKIRAKEKQIEDIQFKLTEYQKKFEAELKEKENLLLDKGKVSEVEYKKQKEAYEVQIAELQRAHKKELADLKDYHSKLIEDLRSEYDAKKSGIEGSNIELAKKLQALQEEKIKTSAEMKIKEIQNKELEKQNQNYLSEINKKSQTLESFAYAINELAQNKRENGYILDPRDFSKIIVIINNNYSVKNGDRGVVIDDEDKRVAEVEFTVEKNYVRASVKGDTKDIKLRPFYRVIVTVKGAMQ